MKTDLAISHLQIVPGEAGRVRIEVVNTADVIDGVTAIVDGINPDWVRLERPLVSLFPDATDAVELVFDIPATCPAGDYLVIVRIVSTLDADRQSVHDFWLTVDPVPGAEIHLTPRIVTGGASAAITATVVNTGNTTAEIAIEALEPTREVDCVTEPANVVVPHGHEAVVEIDMRGKRSWFGDPVSRNVTITARIDDLVVEEVATFKQKPRIPRGLLTALILAGIVLLWALIFLFVISELRNTEPPAKAVGTDFLTGPENIPLSRIAATVEGTVTATTTGGGIPRITVEALRVDSEGMLQSVGSAATEDDGAFSLGSLIPGTYKLRFSADGYSTVWYQSGGDAATADEVALDPQEVLDGLDVEMTGGPGVLAGKVAVPPDAAGVPLTVTATQVVERDDGTTGGAPAVPPVTTDADGNFVLTGLPTPATYEVTVAGPGFQTQQFEQELTGGAAAVLNTVDLTAATGQISGVVVDGDGRPLGGVTVIARSGDTEVRSVTPTTGAVGQFQIIGLATPQTYALTFELANYTSSTAALSLAAGESRTGLSTTLFGGNGTVTGTAVDADGLPLGGATVTVLGEGISATSTTLTTGTPGRFSVTDLPVPGNYTVTISGDDLQAETLSTFFLSGGPRDVGQVVVLSSTSEVSGVVSGPSGGLGEVMITLSDGTQRQPVTRSATNPAGVFTFAGVAPGAYTLTFERQGFQTVVALFDVVAGVDTTQNATLVPAP